MMKTKIILFIFLLLVMPGIAKNPVYNFINNDVIRNANVSLMVKDLNTNHILYEYRPDNATIPASTMKLVTTATALEMLGPDFKFKTTLEIDGTINSDSILNGNLYIRGGGDPTLGSSIFPDSAFLKKWANAVKQSGIKRINGKVIADASLYDNQGINPKWLWEDLGNYYASGAYGISYKDNTYALQLKSSTPGTTPEIIGMNPVIPDIQFENNLKSTTIKSDSAYIYGIPTMNIRTLYGEIPANRSTFFIKGDIPCPGLLLARDFTGTLNASGISIRDSATDIVPEIKQRTVIYAHYSPELRAIIQEINVNSNNHYAEHLFRYLALQQDSVASSKGAVAVIKTFWKSKLLPVDELFMYDGSGLTPVNAVSANFFVSLLSYMNTSPYSSDFLSSMAVAGEKGTLSSFLKNTPLAGKVQAKSGSIHRVKCYAGYIYNKEKKLVFAVMVNNPNGNLKAATKKIEEFLLSVTK